MTMLVWPNRFEFLQDFPTDPALPSELFCPNVVDVTEISEDELIAFSPYLRLIGNNAITERRNNPNGLFYRAVENQQTGERCLQYLYIYKQQYGAIEKETIGILLWIFIHLLIIPFLHSQYYAMIIITSALGIYLFSFGAASHFEDFKKIRKGIRCRPRVRTPFIIAGLLIVVSGFLPVCGIFIFACYLIGLMIGFLLEKKKIVTWSHDMDYAPVFVYIRRNNETNTWNFIKACWDKFHYRVDYYHADLEVHQRLKDQRRIMLKIDNLWHDFTPLYEDMDRNYQAETGEPIGTAAQRGAELNKFISIILSISILGLLLYFFEELQPIQIFPHFFPLLITAAADFSLAGLSFHQFIYIQTRPDRKAKLLDTLYTLHLGLPAHRLSGHKLDWLWKLEDKKMRLKIKEVMQNPFQQFARFDR